MSAQDVCAGRFNDGLYRMSVRALSDRLRRMSAQSGPSLVSAAFGGRERFREWFRVSSREVTRRNVSPCAERQG